VEPIVLSTSGADAEAIDRIRSADWSDGPGLVTEDLIDTFGAAGEPDEVAERLKCYVAAGLKGVNAWHVLGPDPQEGLRLLAHEVWPRVG
jgi:alkanesulfonate monooxygenase SsuD/methylene tetrahydromethanopterin reductase-like flavin-dependent oxidoreductase (luciferase family)